MKVLVTGGAGFIGKWLLDRLPGDVEVVIVDSLDEQVHKECQDFPPAVTARAICIKADIREIDRFAAAAEGTDVVVHLAAQTGTGQSMYEISHYVRHNVDGTARLLELLSSLKGKLPRIVLASSRAVYGEGSFGDAEHPHTSPGRRLEDLRVGRWGIYDSNGNELPPLPMREDQALEPISVYGLTKLWQEQLIENCARSTGLDFLTLRFQNVYGPGQALGNPYTGIIGIFTNAIMHDRPIELFEDGNITRDFVHVGDVADAIVNGIFYAGGLRRAFNCGTGHAVTLWELLRQLEAATGKKARVSCSGRFRVGDVRHAVADMQRYRQTFGPWAPTGLQAGLGMYLQWYLTQPPVQHHLLADSLREMEGKGLLARGGRHQE